MRHKKSFNHLSRTSAHRKAMLANMASSLITHKRINTTVAKAKALRAYIEPLITKSKTDNTHSRRVVFSYLKDKTAVSELFREVAPKVANRPGGYIRIIKTGFRLGDAAEMAMIELVDFNELYGSEEKKTKTRRSRRGGKQKTEATSKEVSAENAETKKEDTKPSAETSKSEAKEKPEAKTDDASEDKDSKKEDGDSK